MAGLLWYRSYMDSLANTNGYYPDIHAGHADRVAELTLDAPYLVRETPAGYNQLELMSLVGGVVAWNQLVQNGNFNSATGWTAAGGVTFSVANNEGTITSVSNNLVYLSQSIATPVGNKILIAIDAKTTLPSSDYFFSYGSVPIFNYSITTIWSRVQTIISRPSSGSDNVNFIRRTNTVLPTGETVTVRNAIYIDLTQMFGSTIADYVYSLERATAGSGIAWLKSYGYFTEDYYAYSAPALEHVKTTAHITKDADDNVLGTYPFDSSLLLRGVPKLENGALIYDGDTYEPDGTVTRYFDIRAYQAGDESLTDAITDGTNTVYKLGAPTTESADPYTAVQDIEEGGTEKFVTVNNVPVGNVSVYRRA